MTATSLIKKLRSKLLGKKSKTSAAGQYPGLVKAVLPLVDKLGSIQLNENWKN